MNKYWFRRREGLFSKDLGWGYIPISIEGWISVIVFIIMIAFSAFFNNIWNNNYTNNSTWRFLWELAILILILIAIAENKIKEK